MGEWSIEHRAKPLLVNAERKGSTHWTTVRRETREWREAFGWLIAAERIPPLVWVHITVDHFTKTARLPDVVACSPAVKAGIDALVDRGVLPDDGPEFVHQVLFRAPQKRGFDAVRLSIMGPVAR